MPVPVSVPALGSRKTMGEDTGLVALFDGMLLEEPEEPEEWDDPLLSQLPGLRDAKLSPQERAALVADRAYWAALCPALHCGDPEMLRAACEAAEAMPDPDLVDECRERMHEEGYFDIPPGEHLPWAVSVAAMAEGVQRICAAGWPPSFLLMYDEPWVLAHQVKNLIYMTTGNKLLGDFSIFHVHQGRTPSGRKDAPGGASSKGWPPHRDRGTDAAAKAFGSDGMPLYATTWIPLTDATPTNSCLYCVPKGADPGYLGGDKGQNPLQAIVGQPSGFQHIRALPAKAGSLINFSHRLLHWGSASSEKAKEWKGEGARIALAFSCAQQGFERPYFSAANLPLPPMALRASLVGGLAIMYVENEDPGPLRRGLFWDVFRANAAMFDSGFEGLVRGHHAAKEAEDRAASAF